MPRSNYAHRLIEYPDLIFPDERALTHRSSWRDFFQARIGPTFDNQLILEIGCNDATFLSTIAQRNPTTAFIGLDWKVKAIYDAAVRVAEMKLNNVALLRTRAQNIAKIFGPKELNEIWIFHPDPCDREVELKNRLIAEPFLLAAHETLKSRASLHLKTDHPGYYQWTLGLFGQAEPEAFRAAHPRTRDLMRPVDLPAASSAIRERYQIRTHSTNYWQDSVALARNAKGFFANEMTNFERRFRDKKHPIYYLEFRKTDAR